MKKLILAILLSGTLFADGVTITKENNNSDTNTSLKDAFLPDELLAQQLSKVLKMIIVEVASKNRYSQNKDLNEVSGVIKVLMSKKQASVGTASDFPKENSSIKIALYDSPKEKNICATLDTNSDYLIIDIKEKNGTVCKYLSNYMKSNKYTILK